MPESFTKYVTSTLVFDLYAAPTNEGMIPSHLATLDDVKFPTDFYEHIVQTTERLKARIEALHEENAIFPQKLAIQSVPTEVQSAPQQRHG